MDVAIIIVMIVFLFFLGRLSVLRTTNKKFLKLKSELSDMTASRDKWREKYLVNAMRAKMKELHKNNDNPPES